jgi:3-dehydroquinate synthetase
VTARVTALLERLGLPVDVASRDLLGASSLLGHDKKRAGARVRFIALREPGEVDQVPLELEELRRLTRALA